MHRLAPDSFNGEVSLEEILETSDGSSVHYVSTKDASTKIGQIADSIRSSLHPENLGLGLLYSSIEALQVGEHKFSCNVVVEQPFLSHVAAGI